MKAVKVCDVDFKTLELIVVIVEVLRVFRVPAAKFEYMHGLVTLNTKTKSLFDISVGAPLVVADILIP